MFAVLFTFAAILPDYVMQYSSVHFRVAFDPVFLASLTLFGFFSVVVGQGRFLCRHAFFNGLSDYSAELYGIFGTSDQSRGYS